MNLMTAIPDITLEQKFSEFKLHAMKIKNMLHRSSIIPEHI